LPGVQKRLAELDTLMTQEGFWNNREKAQGLIDEANGLRKKNRADSQGRTANGGFQGHAGIGPGGTARRTAQT